MSDAAAGGGGGGGTSSSSSSSSSSSGGSSSSSGGSVSGSGSGGGSGGGVTSPAPSRVRGRSVGATQPASPQAAVRYMPSPSDAGFFLLDLVPRLLDAGFAVDAAPHIDAGREARAVPRLADGRADTQAWLLHRALAAPAGARAGWALRHHRAALALGNSERLALFEEAAGGSLACKVCEEEDATVVCASCKGDGEDGVVCDNCCDFLSCEKCGDGVCKSCEVFDCDLCGMSTCERCAGKTIHCWDCDKDHCADCKADMIQCQCCRRYACGEEDPDAEACRSCKKSMCAVCMDRATICGVCKKIYCASCFVPERGAGHCDRCFKAHCANNCLLECILCMGCDEIVCLACTGAGIECKRCKNVYCARCAPPHFSHGYYYTKP